MEKKRSITLLIVVVLKPSPLQILKALPTLSFLFSGGLSCPLPTLKNSSAQKQKICSATFVRQFPRRDCIFPDPTGSIGFFALPTATPVSCAASTRFTTTGGSPHRLPLHPPRRPRDRAYGGSLLCGESGIFRSGKHRQARHRRGMQRGRARP